MKTGNLSLIIQYPSEMRRVRSFLLFPLLVLHGYLSFAQTTPISGVVNTYYKVLNVVPAKACVIVPDAAGLSHNDKVMLVQMKGADINTNSSSSSFGDTTSLNNAGNYEIARVCHVIDDSVFMVFMFLNQYTVSGKVQLVKIPQYYNADVIDTLKPAPWNNAAGTGGVLAIEVEEDLVLNAPIYGDSSGFRGGEFRVSSGDCGNFFPPAATDYAYNANTLSPQDGAFKGEGIADVSAAQSGGRGAPANGGGGGNNHNNGGGGGANLSFGGDGGGNSSSGGCRTNLLGKSGKALSSYSGKKIFAGGGGGAGQANNGFPAAYGGGNGGGIIFIKAKNLAGNNEKITANGQRGSAAIGDGAGGGGAGGTVIMNVNNYIGTTTIESNGGLGGSVNNQATAGRCYGSGGGGSGGAIYFSGATPAVPISVTAGNGGIETSRSGTCNPAISSLAGSTGQVIPDYTYSSSLILESSYCAALLPVELIWFKALYTDDQIILKWQVALPETGERFIVERSGNGSTWIQIDEQPAVEEILFYQHVDPSPHAGTNFYRLKMIDKMNTISYSAIQKIFIPSKNDLIKIYPNPAHKKIIITGNIFPHTELSLYDLSGKLLWNKKVANNQSMREVDLPDLSRGIYLLKIEDVIKKLIIR